MDLLAQPQRHPLAHTFRSVLVPSAPACRVTSGAGSGHLQRAARRAARGGATSRDEHRARACVVRRKAERQARHSERLPFTLGAAPRRAWHAQILLCGKFHGRGRAPDRCFGRRPGLHRQLRQATFLKSLHEVTIYKVTCALTFQSFSAKVWSSSGTIMITLSAPTSSLQTLIAASSGTE